MGNRDTATMHDSIPVIQIRPNCIIEYLEYQGSRLGMGPNIGIESANEAKEEAYSGEIKAAAAKRLKKAVNLLILSSPRAIIYNPVTQMNQPFQIAFLTLTISNNDVMLTAREGYDRLLLPFLKWLRRTKGCNSYIWKAELQARGQLHYHITIGNFILYNEIKDKWNYLQRQAGLLDNYYDSKGHYDANSIDIHSVKNVNDTAAYLCKYMAKPEQCDSVTRNEAGKNQKLKAAEVWGNILSCCPITTVDTVRTEGKVWDCSKNLKKAKMFNIPLTEAHRWTLEEAANRGITRIIEGDMYRIHIMNGSNPVEILSNQEKQLFDNYMASIRNDDDEENDSVDNVKIRNSKLRSIVKLPDTAAADAPALHTPPSAAAATFSF